MAKAEIHAKLVDENGKLRVKVEANGYAPLLAPQAW